MADTEEYFPRGGKKPTTTYFKQSGNFLGAPEKGEKKKKKPKKKSDNDDGYLSDENVAIDNVSYSNGVSRLSYKNIKDGVVILGRVMQVHETKVIISLPNEMRGTVMACHISEPYNKLLEAYVNDQIEKIKELSEMFRLGQFVAVKVLEVTLEESRKVMLTMMPQHINGGRNHTDIGKGDLYQAAVVSVEDHGFIMDIGIPNTRPFLPKKNVNPEITLDCGMVTWCCVKSITSSADSSIVTLSNELSAIQNASPRRKSLLPLLPATSLFFTVDKPVDMGIEGHVFDDTVAYIPREHADKVKGKKPAFGQKVKARVLYVMPTSKTPFLTMKEVFSESQPDLSEEQCIKDAEIIEDAQVIRILGRCVHFKLRKGCVGTMNVKRIAVDENLTDEQVMANSYPIGSAHRVRVLFYSPSDYSYVVSDRPAVLAQQYFTLDQLAAGQHVTAVVQTVTDTHLLVRVDALLGYIPQAHFSDAGILTDPKKPTHSQRSKKFYVGQKLNARVLGINHSRQGLLLTLKPSLLSKSLEALSSYEQAQVGKAYTGCIKLIREYILVSFFNEVVALVPRRYVTQEPLENLSDAFHYGQIVNCTILEVDLEKKKLVGSFTTAPFTPENKGEVKGKKRKITADDAKEVPSEKQQDDKDTETHEKKKKKKKQVDEQDNDIEEVERKKDKKRKKSETTEDDVDENKEESKKKRKKKSKPDTDNSEANVKGVEESDAIETDIHEDSDDVLTPEDLHLIDLSDCNDIKLCKKRVVSLMKNVNCRLKRIDRIQGKINNIENKGLTAKNKVYHTAMHTEILGIEIRIKKLLEAVKNAQAKLVELGYEPTKDKINKRKQNLKQEGDTTNVERVERGKEKKKEVKEKNSKKKKIDIKVVDSLEPVLEVPSAKDFWSTTGSTPVVDNTTEAQSSSSEDEEEEQPKKKRKKLTVAEKLAKAREEEERLREMEKRAIESESQPRSSDQFERALLANPDCSQLWIAYMAFHLQSTELDKARAVCRRALKTINFREDSERLNVWLALLNCESRFGTKESQQSVLEEALQMNDPLQVHSKLLDIYVETSKQQELCSLVDLMLRKYRRQPDVYTRCGQACFKLGLVERARQVMQKAISVLEKKEHVSVLVQFALMERDVGECERAEAVFEQILGVYPQRVDVCCTYVDMLRKGGDLHHLRQVLERMTAQKLPARKMKVLYKKWIEVEEKMGDADKVEEIRQQAMEYIQKAKF